MTRIIANAICSVNSNLPLTDCYCLCNDCGMVNPNEARLGLLKLEVAKFDTVAAFARAHSLDETYIRQLLNHHRSFGERAARNMGEKCFGTPDYFTPKQTGHEKDAQSSISHRPLIKQLHSIAEGINDVGLKKLISNAEDIARLYPSNKKTQSSRKKAA